ncbi:23S rRNA (pseudouridine(1915)-N(3))-methyltransferase RlmH [Clostridium botulinum]|uniref:23S rRNA (pseudouridine(1915)-N(3))-methyltransferase RlmH n=1 Tax=Clostridium botulinum TaxID=1491 RepID=UPI003DA41E81
MNISIISVGKIKEKFLKAAINEYSKRLSKYCKLNIIEVTDEKTPDNSSLKEENIIKEKEGNLILKHIKDTSFVIALDLKGKSITSEEFSNLIENCRLTGKSTITFVIGGSLGLSEQVLSRANYKLSFSKMTFPHQLFRVMLLEQVYRAFRILCKEPYHK